MVNTLTDKKYDELVGLFQTFLFDMVDNAIFSKENVMGGYLSVTTDSNIHEVDLIGDAFILNLCCESMNCYNDYVQKEEKKSKSKKKIKEPKKFAIDDRMLTIANKFKNLEIIDEESKQIELEKEQIKLGRKELIKSLRQRKIKNFIDYVSKQSDDQIMEESTHCDGCGDELVSEIKLIQIMNQANDFDHWMKLIEEIRNKHFDLDIEQE